MEEVTQYVGLLLQEPREEAWRAIRAVAVFGNTGIGHGNPLAVKMACCGHVAKYETPWEIPAEDTPCPCGKPGMWIVRHQEASQ